MIDSGLSPGHELLLVGAAHSQVLQRQLVSVIFGDIPCFSAVGLHAVQLVQGELCHETSSQPRPPLSSYHTRQSCPCVWLVQKQEAGTT